MEYNFKEQNYNRKLEISDWRYSATAIGMLRFFDFIKNDSGENIPYRIEGRYLYYNIEDIYPFDIDKKKEKKKKKEDKKEQDKEEQKYSPEEDKRYLLFIEDWFSDIMHHKSVLTLLEQEVFTEKDISKVNEKLSGNSIMKDVFKGISFNGNNKEAIKTEIEKHRFKIIYKTFQNAKKGYAKFINPSKFRSTTDKICRLRGFYVDKGRKTRSLGFDFEENSRTFYDEIEFDFLPFAFSRGNHSIFINNNTSIDMLLKTNREMEYFLKNKLENDGAWNTIFYSYSESAEFIDYDVEVILKEMEVEQYETIFIRKIAIDIFRTLRKRWQGENFKTSLDKVLRRYFSITDDYKIYIMEEVTQSILNEQYLDDLIERIMKLECKKEENKKSEYPLLKHLIYINEVIYTNLRKMEGKMEKEVDLKGSYKAAIMVVRYFKDNHQENKIKTYRQRLISTLVAKDYERFIEIMLQLSSYAEITFPFMYALLQDFEGNKNQAYNFVNALVDIGEKENGGDKS